MTDDDVAPIRAAIPGDAHRLAKMHVTSWHESYTGILPDKILASLSTEARAASWARILQEPPSVRSTAVYLAEHDGAICGFGSCGAQRAENLEDLGYDGEISAIYVLREFQKQGIGTRLFRHMSLDLIRRGFNGAALWVLRDNLGARRFYERYSGPGYRGKRGCA
ncbi:MAG TPA: GNAT family N-acetyltransferase [Steroidobacteraceae bacterium]